MCFLNPLRLFGITTGWSSRRLINTVSAALESHSDSRVEKNFHHSPFNMRARFIRRSSGCNIAPAFPITPAPQVTHPLLLVPGKRSGAVGGTSSATRSILGPTAPSPRPRRVVGQHAQQRRPRSRSTSAMPVLTQVRAQAQPLVSLDGVRAFGLQGVGANLVRCLCAPSCAGTIARVIPTR